MKSVFLTAAALAFALLTPLAADAKGCIKGAVVGGVAGHMVHHGVLGAIGGCIVGHHMANENSEPSPPQAQNHRLSAAPQGAGPQNPQ